MCRKIIHHRMHHDVRVPMMLPDPNNELRMYANPLRTTFHRCEMWPPTTATTPCEYHSCCSPLRERRLCISALEILRRRGYYQLSDVEPEECERFVLEHRHHRLEHLGMPSGSGSLQQQQQQQQQHREQEMADVEEEDGEGYSEWDIEAEKAEREWEEAQQETGEWEDYDDDDEEEEEGGEGGEVSKWRTDLDELQWRDDNGNLSPGATAGGGLAPLAVPFAHQGRFRGAWEECLFLEAERLYVLVTDAETHYAVLRDLSVGAARIFSSAAAAAAAAAAAMPEGGIPFCCWEPMDLATSSATTAGLNYVRAREALEILRRDVEGMLRWGGVACLKCW